MKIFDSDGRINFVDENNVLVGFDNSQSCCESFGYFFSKSQPIQDDAPDNVDECADGFNFDPEYFKQIHDGAYDEGGLATFRLSNGSGEELFLSIYNHHNGYYSHGFSLEVGGKTVRTGSL